MGTGSDGTASSDAAFHEAVFRTGPLACMLLLAGAALVWGPAWTCRLAAVPWLVSLVCVGLPHGAADLAVARHALSGWPAVWLCAVYVAVMGFVAVALAVMPGPVIVAFSLVSAWHFGVAHADGRRPAERATLLSRGCDAVALGGPALGVPLMVWPHGSGRVADELLALLSPVLSPARSPDGGTSQAWADLFAPATVQAFGLVLVSAGILALAAGLLRTRGRRAAVQEWGAGAADLLPICLLGVATDPLFSVGIYFLCWHAWRHMDALGPVVAGLSPTSPARLLRCISRIHVASLPLLLPTWGALAAAWWWLSPAHSARDLAILSLGVYLVVTPAHELLIDLLLRARPVEPHHFGIGSVSMGTGGPGAIAAPGGSCSGGIGTP